MSITTTGLNAEYLLREGSGTTAHDTSGNSQDGTFDANYPPTWAAKGISLTTTNDSIILPTSVLADDNTSVDAHSVEVWYQYTGSDIGLDSGGLICYVDDLSGIFTDKAGVIGFFNCSADASLFDQANTFPDSCDDGNWHHLVFCRDTSNYYLYIDNALFLQMKRGVTGPMCLNPGALASPIAGNKTIGADNSNNGYSAQNTNIGEVRFYTICLTASQVNDNYTASAVRY